LRIKKLFIYVLLKDSQLFPRTLNIQETFQVIKGISILFPIRHAGNLFSADPVLMGGDGLGKDQCADGKKTRILGKVLDAQREWIGNSLIGTPRGSFRG